MYETYTRQSLPDKDYRELLGSAISVFNSNNAFIIENILRISGDQHNWWELIDRTSGSILHKVMQEQYSDIIPENIISLFSDLVEQRDRIIHSFQITGPEPNPNQEQLLATKVKGSGEQFIIIRKYLLEFIQKNDELSDLLDAFREQLE